jgi:Tol biopolymer transport system component
VGTQPRNEVLKFDLAAREFTVFKPGLAAFFTYSRDGAWVAWGEWNGREASLWRSRVDGSERVQLTGAPLKIFNMSWSPDATRIAFMAQRAGEPWRIYLIDADGGTPVPVLDWDRSEADPNFSADGQSLMFGHPPDYMAEPDFVKEIRIVDLRTKGVSTLPGSRGLFSPRWSPDGRYVAAMPLDQGKIMLFDYEIGTWSEVVPGRSGDRRPGRWRPNYPFWSSDSTLLYFQNFGEERGPLYRVHLRDRSLERVVDFADIKRPLQLCIYRSLALDGSPLASCNASTSDIYALEWDPS